MIAPYRTVALDRRMLAVHAKPSAHGTPSTQGGLGTPLTMDTQSPELFLYADASGMEWQQTRPGSGRKMLHSDSRPAS
jgi:hypothetical protein